MARRSTSTWGRRGCVSTGEEGTASDPPPGHFRGETPGPVYLRVRRRDAVGVPGDNPTGRQKRPPRGGRECAGVTWRIRGLSTLDEPDRRRLSAQGVPVLEREFRAWTAISEEIEPIPFRDPRLRRVAAWLADRYGGRLNAHPHIGRMLVSIRRVPFVVACPLVYGRAPVNSMDMVNDAGPGVLRGIPEDELRALASTSISLGCPGVPASGRPPPLPTAGRQDCEGGHRLQRSPLLSTRPGYRKSQNRPPVAS